MTFGDICIVTRAWSFNITLISVTLGTILAWQQTKISLLMYLLCLFGALLFHAGANTLNDYFDLKHKIDSPQSPTALYRPHPVFANILSSRGLLIFSCVLLASSLCIGLGLAITQSRWIWSIMSLGLIFAVFYTATPHGFKYIALGEPVVFLTFGPMMIEGAYTVQTSSLSWKALFVSMIWGLLAALIIMANNLRDAEFDAKCGVRTLSTILGQKRSLRLYNALSLAPFLLISIYLFTGLLRWHVFMVFLSLPLAVRLNSEFTISLPKDADAKTSRFSSVFGILLIVSLLLDKFF
jgi:1,4-dihydroxy-2-naphthoate octaprenyltransferase